MRNPQDLKIAWLLPVAWFYWQPAISELTKIFPNTSVFTGLFPGFAKGLEDTLNVEVICGCDLKLSSLVRLGCGRFWPWC
jgi:hypothetical protein